jgi:hypothetical protein
MKFPSPLASILFALVGTVSAEDSTAGCAAETAVIQLNNGYEQAVAAYNAALVNQTLMCLETAQSSCDLDLDAEESAIEQACTEANGMIYDPSLSVQCDNSNTKVTTTWEEDYTFCIGLNCTNTDELEAQLNDFLANATAAINVFLNPNGVDCSAYVSSANRMPFSGWVAAIGTVVAAMLFVTIH